jgi:hypothetical protein
VAAREKWRQDQPRLDVKKLKFLDESSINTGMTPLYGWGEKSKRVNDYVPDVRFERASIIATLSTHDFSRNAE